MAQLLIDFPQDVFQPLSKPIKHMNGLFVGMKNLLDLINVPWPISILKCNLRVDKMQPGERLQVAVKDEDTKQNLVMLLSAMEDYDFDCCRSQGCYLLNIKRRSTTSP